MNLQEMLNGMEDPYDRLNRLEHAIGDLLRQRAELLQHIAGLTMNQNNLVGMYDDLDRRLKVLEAIFTEKV